MPTADRIDSGQGAILAQVANSYKNSPSIANRSQIIEENSQGLADAMVQKGVSKSTVLSEINMFDTSQKVPDLKS